MKKQREYCIDEQHQNEKQITERNGENNQLQQMKKIEEYNISLFEQQLEEMKVKQKREANKLTVELKSAKDEIKIQATKTKTMLECMNIKEFITECLYTKDRRTR